MVKKTNLVNVVCERPLSCISDFLERSLFLVNWTFSEFFGVHGNICRKLDFPPLKWPGAKAQIISKANCQAVNSSKKQTNEFVFTTMRHVFIRLLEEIEDS